MSNPDFELINSVCQAVTEYGLDSLSFEKEGCKISVKFNPSSKFAEQITEKLAAAQPTDDELLLDPYKGL